MTARAYYDYYQRDGRALLTRPGRDWEWTHAPETVTTAYRPRWLSVHCRKLILCVDFEPPVIRIVRDDEDILTLVSATVAYERHLAQRRRPGRPALTGTHDAETSVGR